MSFATSLPKEIQSIPHLLASTKIDALSVAVNKIIVLTTPRKHLELFQIEA